jgi:hypothetical protein
MSLSKVEKFLDALAVSDPGGSTSLLLHCNRVWKASFPNEEFLEFHGVLEEAIEASRLMDLLPEHRAILRETLLEIKNNFTISTLTSDAMSILQQSRREFRLLARSIRHFLAGTQLVYEQETELTGIEAEILELESSCEASPNLSPEQKVAIEEIAALLHDATIKIREDGIEGFKLKSVFLFGEIQLMFKNGDISDTTQGASIGKISRRLWNLACNVNTAFDIYDKLTNTSG